MNSDEKQVSASRMRIGVVCLVIWWVPFWALAPSIANTFGLKASVVTIVIMGIQTIIGFLGIWVAGKEVSILFKQTPKRQVPGKIWHVLVRGSF